MSRSILLKEMIPQFPLQALSEMIDECESLCETDNTDQSEELCTRPENISADCILIPPVPP